MIVKEILFRDGDKVNISDDGMAYNAFKKLYAADKDPHKKYFKEVVKAIFFLYSVNSPVPVTGMGYEERVEIVQNNWLKKDWKKLSRSPKVKECIDLYKKITYRKDRELIKNVLQDMDDFMSHLQNIKSHKKVKIKLNRKNEETGEMETVDAIDEVYNFEEKIKAYKDFDKLQELYEKFEEKLRMEHNAVNNNQKIFEVDKEAPANDVMTYSHVKT